MKKYIALAIIVVGVSIFMLYHRLTDIPNRVIPVVIVDGYEEQTDYDEVEGIKSILQEEGVDFDIMSAERLMCYEPQDLVKRVYALIFVDHATRMASKQLLWWTRRYVKKGGWVLVSYDSGTRNLEGRYHSSGIWSRLCGVRYFQYERLRSATATLGYLRLPDHSTVRILQWPIGKMNEQGFVTGYKYGPLTYPMSIAKKLYKNVKILLEGITKNGLKVPVLSVRHVGKGGVMLANIPLGALKVNSDDLSARNILKAFLFHYAGIPHIVSAPGGIGGLVINWHVDWGEELYNLIWFYNHHFLRKDLRYSFHVTAGTYRDAPGDGLGFMANTLRGMVVLNIIGQFGAIGSHGGWGHNWFARNVESGRFGAPEITHYIGINNSVLEMDIGYAIKEYAAPNGVHPQPVTTLVLRNLGIVAYYYPGDSGSVPNRTFFNGKMVAPDVVAFPVMPYKDTASLYEAQKEGFSEAQITAWLTGMLDNLARYRVVRLWYSHPYDVPATFPDAVQTFLDHAEELQRQGKLSVLPMEFYAEFLLRLVKVHQKILPVAHKKSLEIVLHNSRGLENMCLALPKSRFSRPDRYVGDEDEENYYLCVAGDPSGFSVVVPLR